MGRRHRAVTSKNGEPKDTHRYRQNKDNGTNTAGEIDIKSTDRCHENSLAMESQAHESFSASPEENHQSQPLGDSVGVTDFISSEDKMIESNIDNNLSFSDIEDHEEEEEIDEDIDEFTKNMHDLEDDHGNDHESHTRPPSANSITSFSSVLKKIQASNVFQETSTVLNEVIKHTTFCGVQREKGNGNEHGNDKVGGDDTFGDRLRPPMGVEDDIPLSARPPPEAIPIPLRHIQSSPTQSHQPMMGFINGSENGPIMMKRSVSTPPTFSQSLRGSAFGKVYGSSPFTTQYQIHRSQNALRSASAFQPVGIKNRVPLPLSRAVSIDTGSVASTDEASIASNTSMMTAKAQKSIKARRRKMKQQKSDAIVNEGKAHHSESIETVNDSFSSSDSAAVEIQKTKTDLKRTESKDSPVEAPVKTPVETPVEAPVETPVETPVVSNFKFLRVKKIKADKARRKKKASFSNPFKKQVDSTVEPNSSDPAPTLPPPITLTNVDSIPTALENSNDSDTKDVSYLPLQGENDTETEAIDENTPNVIESNSLDVEDSISQEGEEEADIFTELRGKESPSPIPFPAYQQINDDDNANSNPHPTSNPNPPLPSQPRSRSKGYGHSSPSTTRTQPRLILPLGNRSPCSQDSCSFSKSTRSGQSLNTTFNSQSHLSNTSCNRSVTSSVAEADREVRETNRRELRRYEMVDLDGTQSIQSLPSIQSSDTTSTNPHAYLALNSSNAQLREGASMQFDRFFARNGSTAYINGNTSRHHQASGPSVGSGSQSNVSSLHQSLVSGNSATGGRPPAMNARSPNTISSNSQSTDSVGDEHHRPPSFISAKLNKGGKVAPVPSPNDGVGYSRLGSGSDGMMVHGMSSSSSKSSSMSSRSSSSKSRRKGKKDLTQRSYQKMRTSTPSPCNSFPASPVKTPISPPNEFNFSKPIDVRKPDVRRQVPPNHYGKQNYNHVPSQKMVLVSPDGSTGPSFHPTSTVTFKGAFRGVVTPEKRSSDEHVSHFRF